MRYKELHSAQLHDIGISSLDFSSRGKLLATAGLDGRVGIWRVHARGLELLHTYKNQAGVLSLGWICNGEDSVVVGYQNGNVAILSLTANLMSLHGFQAHDKPVECLANWGAMIATAALDEVRVWEWHPVAPWTLVVALSEPTKRAENLQKEVLVVSLHWTSWGDHPLVLVVSYQSHGIMMYEATSWTLVHALNVYDPIARTSISPDGHLIAIYNLAKGIEVRGAVDGALRCSFPQDGSDKYLLPVLFIHHGCAVLGGSTTGTVNVWNLNTSQRIQSMEHAEKDRVIALAAHHDESSDRFLIATGTLPVRARPTVRLWVAENEDRDRQAAGTVTIRSPGEGAEMTRSTAWYTWVLLAAVVFFTLLAFTPLDYE